MRLLAMGALVVTAVLVLPGCAAGANSETSRTIAINYSRFGPGVIAVTAGVPVTLTLRNDDPIEHEWIVGTPICAVRRL